MKSVNYVFGPDKSINWQENDIREAFASQDYNRKINNETMLMHSVKINSKNYHEYGKVKDYTDYIYDKIDNEDEQL